MKAENIAKILFSQNEEESTKTWLIHGDEYKLVTSTEGNYKYNLVMMHDGRF